MLSCAGTLTGASDDVSVVLAVALTVVLFLLVVEPLLVLWHELGHALAPVVRGHETAVFLGGERGLTVSLGLLSITVTPRGFLRPITYGATATDVEADRGTIVAGALGGPILSLLLLVVAWRVLIADVPAVVRWSALLSGVYLWFQTVFTLLPVRAPGWTPETGGYRSDGMIVLDAVRGRDVDGERSASDPTDDGA